MEIITNEGENTLLNHLKRFKNAKEISILVGYAYFSGFKAIINDPEVLEIFKKVEVKILIGMDFDPKLKRVYSSYYEDEPKSDYELKSESRGNYIGSCNTEAPENKDVLHTFFKKAKEGTLKINKTKKSVHAKLYIFHENSYTKGTFITGSSNLTISGLKTQTEFNIVDSDKDEVDTAKKFFDNLWSDENSVPILDVESAPDMRKKIGLLRKPSPYEVYLKVIYEYFQYADRLKIEYIPSHAGFNDYKYQTDAIKKSLRMINNYNGVLISDVVGLGKSIIASVVARNLYNTGKMKKVYVICPPALKDQWYNYMENVGLIDYAAIESVGQLKNIEETISKSRETSVDKRECLIIIDEAHRFRNSGTNSYSMIKSICRWNKVMLLTATPMHNTTSDIFSLVDLLGSKIFENNNTDDFRAKIKKKEKDIRRLSKEDKLETDDEKKLREISKSVLNYINPVLIRRTRVDLIADKEYKLDLEKQQIELNKVADPEAHDYKLGKYSDIYIDTLEKISPSPTTDDNATKNSHFMGVRYNPLQYLIDDKKLREDIVADIYGDTSKVKFALESSRNLSKFMRHLLIRRFESSVQAFRETIDSLIEKYELIKKFIEKDEYPVYKSGNVANLENALKSSVFDETDYLDDDFNKDEDIDDSGIYIIKNLKSKLDPQFFIDFDNDLNILKGIKKEWAEIVEDKKFNELKKKLLEWQKENKNRKIIIFSEFVSTVKYLEKKINEDIEIRNILKPISFTSKDKGYKRVTIINNFDASVKEEEQENNHFLLIATDTLSEGINLHRAGVIINYDIPYNPTKVIQRVGRINRIGKKVFDKLFIHNFFPRVEVRGELKNLQISSFKLKLINGIFGNDTKILHKDEDIKPAFSLKNNTNIIDDDNELSWDTEYRNIFYEIKNNPQILEKIINMPNNLALLRENTGRSGLISVKRFGNQIEFTCLDGGFLIYDEEKIFDMLKADESEKYISTTDNLKEYEKKIKHLKNTRKKVNTDNSIIYLDDLIKKVYDKKINLSENNLDYITSLSRFAKAGSLGTTELKYIEKIFKSRDSRDSYEEKIKLIQEKIPMSRIKNDESSSKQKYGDFIVREEMS